MRSFLTSIFFLALITNIALATERGYANLQSNEIQVNGNGAIGIQRPSKLNDTIVLVKGLDKSFDISRFSNDEVHQEVVQFFEKLVTQYKFNKSDRRYIAYGALGESWFGKGLYQLDISEIIKLNNRDFGENDRNLVDSNGNKFVPLKVLFSNLTVINPRSLKENKSATRSLRSYVQKYKFGGIVRIREGMVENSWAQGHLAVVTDNVLGCIDKESARLSGLGLISVDEELLRQLLVGKDAKCIFLEKDKKNIIKVISTETEKVNDILTINFVTSRVIVLNGENVDDKNFVMQSSYPYVKADGKVEGKIFYKEL